MSTAENKAVFLSYASQDAEAARRICEALRAAGVEVWFDQSELVGGDAWDAKIRGQISSCALFVPLVSANTQARLEGYFRIEWKLAAQRTHAMAEAKPFLLPVAIDTTRDAEAHVPAEFKAVQWTRLPGGEASAAFAARAKKLLESGGVDAGPVADRAPGHRPGLQPGRPRPGERGEGAASPGRERVPAGKSVAVLAFANLSRDRDNEYFSDGISEELLNVLAKIPGLKISARTSAFHFKGKDTPIPEIARQLGVAYVVEGSVRKSGDRVRITAQLIKAADGFHVWSDTFTRELKDIFAVQDEIAGLIAKNLELKLGTKSAVRTVNPDAYALLLQGRAIFNRGIPADYARGIRCYQESLALDGDSALTWASLAVGYAITAAQGAMRLEAGFPLAREAAHRAVALDADLAQAHYAQGLVSFLADWDWAQAEASFQRALALSPNEVNALGSAATVAQTVGQADRAVAMSRRAVELDPLGFSPAYSLAKSFLQTGRYAELEKQAERMIEVNSAGRYGYVFLTFARLLQGRVEAAASAMEPMSPDFFQATCRALVRHAQGRAAESDAALHELQTKFGPEVSYQIAQVCAYRNEPDRAFEALETGYRARDPGLTWITYDPFMRNLRGDARWPALLQKMNLPNLPLT